MIEFDAKNRLNDGTSQRGPAESAKAARKAPRKYGLLVIDDDADVRGVVDAAMRRQGFAEWPAATGQEALTIYRRHRDSIAAGGRIAKENRRISRFWLTVGVSRVKLRGTQQS